MSFYRETQVKSVRKPHSCGGCGHIIPIGEPALNVAGHYEGEFWGAYFHADCRAAEIYLNTVYGLHEWSPLCDFQEPEDRALLLESYPDVAARLGVTREGVEA